MLVAITAREMNDLNKTFWADQKVLMGQRLERREVALVATQFLADEVRRQVPVGHRRSFEKALQDAEGVARTIREALIGDEALTKPILIESARKAGSSPKIDALSKLIKELVVKRPDLSLQELLLKLEEHKGADVINDIGDESVWFINKGDRIKEAPLSGLRGRLSRAKAEFRRTQSR